MPARVKRWIRHKLRKIDIYTVLFYSSPTLKRMLFKRHTHESRCFGRGWFIKPSDMAFYFLTVLNFAPLVVLY
ncbi:MAG: hypothetical protein CTY16_07355 [Methylobacter sp.]|nr:MAG: hypothetical protein CTY16_07355 [Methylobacter sp.]